MTSQRKEHVGYNFVAIFIRLVVVGCCLASQICKIPRNSTKIRTYSSSRSSKVTDLGVNWKCICNLLLLINSNYGHISYHFRYTPCLKKVAHYIEHHKFVKFLPNLTLFEVSW